MWWLQDISRTQAFCTFSATPYCSSYSLQLQHSVCILGKKREKGHEPPELVPSQHFLGSLMPEQCCGISSGSMLGLFSPAHCHPSQVWFLWILVDSSEFLQEKTVTIQVTWNAFLVNQAYTIFPCVICTNAHLHYF